MAGEVEDLTGVSADPRAGDPREGDDVIEPLGSFSLSSILRLVPAEGLLGSTALRDAGEEARLGEPGEANADDADPAEPMELKSIFFRTPPRAR